MKWVLATFLLISVNAYSGVKRSIVDASTKENVSYIILCKIAYLESKHNPRARAGGKSTARGLFQIIKSTEKIYRKRLKLKGSIYNPLVNSLIAAALLKDNIAYLNKKLKRYTLKLSDYYLLHFLGAGKTVLFIKAKWNKIAAKVFPKEAKYNRALFYFRNGKAKTIRQMRIMFNRKMNRAKVL